MNVTAAAAATVVMMAAVGMHQDCPYDPAQRIWDDVRHPQEPGTPPPKVIPAFLLDAFTRCGAINVSHFYVDDTLGGKGLNVRFPAEAFEQQLASTRALVARADAAGGEAFFLRMPGAFGRAAAAMLRHRSLFEGARVAVFGSQRPTYETMALALGAASVTVFEFQVPEYEHGAVESRQVRELLAAASRAHGWSGRQFTDEEAARGAEMLQNAPAGSVLPQHQGFDVAVAVSGFDHDGLGRYGEGLCPDCDLRAMDAVAAVLRQGDGSDAGGVLLVSVPVGPDALAFNLHRRYGTVRLPLLLHGWRPVDTVDWRPARLSAALPVTQSYEPVFVLRHNGVHSWEAWVRKQLQTTQA